MWLCVMIAGLECIGSWLQARFAHWFVYFDWWFVVRFLNLWLYCLIVRGCLLGCGMCWILLSGGLIMSCCTEPVLRGVLKVCC